MYEYKADIDWESRYPQGAYDGDTIDFLLDMGFKDRKRQRVRLLGVNTAELKGDRRDEGIKFRELTRNWLQSAEDNTDKWAFVVKTTKIDSFGRYLADVTRVDTGENLSEYLLWAGAPPFVKRKSKKK